MLTHLSKHSKIDTTIRAKGDLDVDSHHTVEDIGLCLGECLDNALGDKKGINRYGNSSVPMEDSLANVSIDLSGRPSCVYNVEYRTSKIGDFDVECLEEMLRSFSNAGKFNLHINVPYGTSMAGNPVRAVHDVLLDDGPLQPWVASPRSGPSRRTASPPITTKLVPRRQRLPKSALAADATAAAWSADIGIATNGGYPVSMAIIGTAADKSTAYEILFDITNVNDPANVVTAPTNVTGG